MRRKRIAVPWVVVGLTITGCTSVFGDPFEGYSLNRCSARGGCSDASVEASGGSKGAGTSGGRSMDAAGAAAHFGSGGSGNSAGGGEGGSVEKPDAGEGIAVSHDGAGGSVSVGVSDAGDRSRADASLSTPDSGDAAPTGPERSDAHIPGSKLGTITEFPVPTPNAYVQDITAGPDGALWFTEYHGGKIG